MRTFTDQAAFEAAVGTGLELIDFTGLAPASLATLDETTAAFPIAAGDIPAGVAFSSTGGTSGDLFLAPVGFFGVTSDSLVVPMFGNPLIVEFDPGVTAVGSDVLSFFSATNIVITLRDADASTFELTVALPPAALGYLGIVADEGEIVRIEYDPPSGFSVGVDNFSFGQAESGDPLVILDAVPEPASFILFGMGAAGLAVAGRRRR